MSLVVDEMLVPALGLSPPNRAFPILTHVRGFVNHLAYGAAVALTAETIYRLTGTTPGTRRADVRELAGGSQPSDGGSDNPFRLRP